MGKPKAGWSIALYVECPYCKGEVDLVCHPEFWEKTSIEIAAECEDVRVICPECGHEFLVDTVY